MSASQDKKKRTQQRADGTERRQVASRKAAQEKKKSRTKWIIGSIVVVLLIAFIIAGNSNLFYTAQKAVKINGKSYSVAEFNYEYMSVYQQYSQLYSQYLGDASAVAPDAPYTGDDEDGDAFKTWDDFYRDSAIRSIAQKEALVSMAEEAGVELTEEEIQEVDDSLETMRTMATQYGYANLSKFLSANYGNGVTEKLARQLMLRDALATKYQTYYQDNLTYTDEQLQAAYTENKDEYDSYSFSYYFVQAESETTTDADGNETATVSEASMAAAKETADKILAESNGTAEGFAAAVAANGAPTSTPETDENGQAVVDDEGNPVTTETPAEPTAAEGTQGSELTTNALPFGDWLKEADRAVGDMTVVEQAENGYYVVLFQGRDDNSYNTVNVRHILIQAEDADGDGAYSEEELAAAKVRIEEIKAEYEAGEQTEDAFAALANKYSTDGGSNTNGGLYENVYRGQMIAEFNDFCFDPARQPGDVEIIEDTTYNGYHLMYYVGEGENYQNVLARNALTSDAMSAFSASLTENIDFQELFAMRYAGIK